MATFRFYACDDQGRIVSGANKDCPDETAAKKLARQLLVESNDKVQAIEVWDMKLILHRLRRSDLSPGQGERDGEGDPSEVRP